MSTTDSNVAIRSEDRGEHSSNVRTVTLVTETEEEIARVKIRTERRLTNMTSQVFNNGISLSSFVDEEIQSMEQLEMCHFNYPVMNGLQYFANHLKWLSIVAQDITEITGLESCLALKKIWICETKISEIDGLTFCPNLEELYLCNNQIKRIQGLTHLPELRKLWLSDNQIERIENLEHLGKLQELQIGNNRITNLNNAFYGNPNLQRLNISGNLIAHFDDLISLSHLPNLTHLWLEDPNFARNSVCSLNNYQTFLIHAIPRLQILDTIEITPAYRVTVEDIVDKKIMYYNMRMRTIGRNIHFLMNLLDNEYGYDVAEGESFRDKLIMRIKMLRRVLHDVQILEEFSGDKERAKEITDKVELAISTLSKQVATIESIIKIKSTHKEHVFEILKASRNLSSHKVFLELETGGNLRFEDVDTSKMPVDTLDIFQKLKQQSTIQCSGRNITLMRIVKVNSKRASLVSAVPKALEEALSVKKVGNKVPNGTPMALIKGHCVLVEGEGERSLFGTLDPNSTSAICPQPSKGIVCYNHFPFINQKEMVLQCIVCSYGSVEPLQFSGTGVAVLDGNQVKSNNLIPEFVCELYGEHKSTPFISSTSRLEWPIVEFACSKFLGYGDLPEMSVRQIFKDSGESADQQPCAIHPEFSAAKWEEIENAFPILSFMEKTLILSPESYDDLPDSHEVMHIYQANMGQLSKLCRLSNLKILSLVSLQLDCVPAAIKSCITLEELDLSLNQIQNIHGCTFPSLKKLELYGNDINHASDLDCKLPALISLDLRSNPITKRRSYHLSLQLIFPTLKDLDGAEFIPSTMPATLTSEVVLHNSLPSDQLYPSFASRTSYCQPVQDKRSEFILNRTIKSAIDSLDHIVIIELDSCKLLSLDGLPDSMPNLKKASFKYNLIGDVDKLTNYSGLEELFLEGNEIDCIDSLCVLGRLKLLDLTDNQITSIKVPRGVTAFAGLTCLCLERNYIQQCSFLGEFHGLQDVYLGNNLLTQEHSNIYSLKRLQNLVILDLSNNPLCEIEHFKLFTVYHLSKLKVLNGSILNPKDLTDARSKFAGKLTFELLKEKIGVSQVRNLTELDLQNCKLKEMACFNSGEFKNLRRLNLDNNLIDNIEGFRALRNLQALSLNNNRIEMLWKDEKDIAETETRPIRGDFPYLEDLRLGYNIISKIADLQLNKLVKLKILHLQGNKISKLEGLDGLNGLQELVLDKNHIREADPSSFYSLINLKSLHLRENRIRTLSHFNCLPNLRYLYLSSNRLQEMSEVEKMNLPSLIDISFTGNSIARKLLYRILVINRFPQILFIDGKEVSEEELERARIYGMEIHRTQFPEMPFYPAHSLNHNYASALSSTTTLALQTPIALSASSLSMSNGNIALSGNSIQTFQFTSKSGALKLSSVLLDGSHMGTLTENNHHRK